MNISLSQYLAGTPVACRKVKQRAAFMLCCSCGVCGGAHARHTALEVRGEPIELVLAFHCVATRSLIHCYINQASWSKGTSRFSCLCIHLPVGKHCTWGFRGHGCSRVLGICMQVIRFVWREFYPLNHLPSLESVYVCSEQVVSMCPESIGADGSL